MVCTSGVVPPLAVCTSGIASPSGGERVVSVGGEEVRREQGVVLPLETRVLELSQVFGQDHREPAGSESRVTITQGASVCVCVCVCVCVFVCVRVCVRIQGFKSSTPDSTFGEISFLRSEQHARFLPQRLDLRDLHHTHRSQNPDLIPQSNGTLTGSGARLTGSGSGLTGSRAGHQIWFQTHWKWLWAQGQWFWDSAEVAVGSPEVDSPDVGEDGGEVVVQPREAGLVAQPPHDGAEQLVLAAHDEVRALQHRDEVLPVEPDPVT